MFLLGLIAGTILALTIWGIQEIGEPERVYARPSVLAFARLMEETLKRNDYKGGWEECDLDWTRAKLKEETDEFLAELDEPLVANLLVGEATDVANVMLITLDNQGLLK
jgi:hypothetical protein